MDLNNYAIVKWRPRTSTFGESIHSLELVESGLTKENIIHIQSKLKQCGSDEDDIHFKEKYEHAFVISMVKLNEFDFSLV